MGALEYIKKIFIKKNLSKGKHPEGIKGFSKEDMDKSLNSLLYETCVKHAADFVKDELNRSDSPFSRLSRSKFFHEVMLINFWIIDKTLEEKQKTLQAEIHKKYLEYFRISEKGWDDLVSERYKAYYESWDEHSGFHDEFGVKASENIFGRETGIPFARTSFWIITYTDKTIKAFSKTCSRAGIKI